MPAPRRNISSGVLSLTAIGWVYLFLAAGVLNVLTAWALPQLLPAIPLQISLSNLQRPFRQWPDRAPATWPERCDYVAHSLSISAHSTIASFDQPNLNGTYYEMRVQRVGFPIPTLVYSSCLERTYTAPPTPVPPIAFATQYPSGNRIPIYEYYDYSRGPGYDGIGPNSFRRPNFLPIRPLWRGFLINTLFYAAILYTLLVTKRSLTYSRRYIKHRCPTCGYDLKGLSTCPECGKLPVAPLSGL